MKSLGLFSRTVSVIISAFCLLFLIGAPLAHAQSAFSYPPFPTTVATGLEVNGNASVGNGNLLTLTPALGSQVGSAWYTNPGTGTTAMPLSLLNGFTTTFTFQLSNQGGIAGTNGKVGADGIAFIIQNGAFSNGTSGATAVATNTGTGGEIGFNGLTHSLAIQFDTWCNSEYHDTCSTSSNNTSADQLTIESCGAAANTVNHNGNCSFGTVPDLSALSTPIKLADGAVHTAQITYVPPANPAAGNCPKGSTSTTAGCGSLTIVIDGQTLLTVPFNLALLGLDAGDDAYAGFTGATGGSWELQNVLSWNFSVTKVETFSTDAPTTSDFTTPGGQNTQTLDLTTAKGALTCKDAQGNVITCPTITLSTSNVVVPADSTWPQYVGGTPWATSICAARPANGVAGNLCSLFVNACFGGTISQNQASDFFCPSVTPGAQDSTITIKDTWDPLDPKPDIAPGTTVSLIDFVPATPSETWSPSTLGTTNPVCTDVLTPGFKCDISDTLIQMYGDQTTTKGSKPKKGWIVTVFNVPMLTTTWSVGGGSGCPTASATQLNNPPPATDQPPTTWFNGNCTVQFTVNQATAPPTPNNGYVAAPPASITFGQGPAKGSDMVFPPTGDQSQTNTSNPLASPWMSSPGTLQQLITSINGGGDGSYTLHWSAVDNVGISERNIQLLTSGAPADCDNPETDPNLKPPCYNTSLFTTNLNMDSVAPAANCPPADTTTWFKTDVTVNCSASDVTSGIGSATPSVSGVPAGPGVPVNFTLQTGVGPGNWSGNASTNTQTLWDLAMNRTDVSESGFKIDEVAPTVSSIVLSPSGGSYTVGQKVTATFSCGDVGSGLTVNPCVSTTGVGSGGYIDTSSTGPHTFTVTATDLAGNSTTNFVNYTVSAPSADVALFEQPGSATHGTTFNAVFWALDLSSNAASNVTINATLNLPPNVLGGNVSAVAGLVSCTLAGCNTLTTGTTCTVTSNTTVSCPIGNLPSVLKITGAAVKISIPIASGAKGLKFTVSGVVTSANDPNSKNNTASQTFTVSK